MCGLMGRSTSVIPSSVQSHSFLLSVNMHYFYQYNIYQIIPFFVCVFCCTWPAATYVGIQTKMGAHHTLNKLSRKNNDSSNKIQPRSRPQVDSFFHPANIIYAGVQLNPRQQSNTNRFKKPSSNIIFKQGLLTFDMKKYGDENQATISQINCRVNISIIVG